MEYENISIGIIITTIIFIAIQTFLYDKKIKELNEELEYFYNKENLEVVNRSKEYILYYETRMFIMKNGKNYYLDESNVIERSEFFLNENKIEKLDDESNLIIIKQENM